MCSIISFIIATERWIVCIEATVLFYILIVGMKYIDWTVSNSGALALLLSRLCWLVWVILGNLRVWMLPSSVRQVNSSTCAFILITSDRTSSAFGTQNEPKSDGFWQTHLICNSPADKQHSSTTVNLQRLWRNGARSSVVVNRLMMLLQRACLSPKAITAPPAALNTFETWWPSR